MSEVQGWLLLLENGCFGALLVILVGAGLTAIEHAIKGRKE